MLYWTDPGLNTIEKASMDGELRTVLHNTNLESPYALTIDYDNQTLFWADYSLNRLESSSVDGSERTLLTTVNIHSPFDITFYDGQLYWTDTSYDAILTTPLSSPNSVTFLRTSLGGNPYGIQIISYERQPNGIITLLFAFRMKRLECSIQSGLPFIGEWSAHLSYFHSLKPMFTQNWWL